MNWHYRIAMSGVVAAVYLLSLVLPAYAFNPFRNATSPGEPMPGWRCVIFGAAIVLDPKTSTESEEKTKELQLLLGWAPNPLLSLGVVLLACRGTILAGSAVLFGILGLLGSLTWLYNDWPNTSLHSGYYVWVLSMMLLAMGGVVRIIYTQMYDSRSSSSGSDRDLQQDDDK
jgi:hypothetical protein